MSEYKPDKCEVCGSVHSKFQPHRFEDKKEVFEQVKKGIGRKSEPLNTGLAPEGTKAPLNPPSPIDLTRKPRGRKRIWLNNADRQKAYRERLKGNPK